jgi:hypothetical protein
MLSSYSTLPHNLTALPDESLEGSPPDGGEVSSLEQAKKVNVMAKIAASERKRLVFIMNSYG